MDGKMTMTNDGKRVKFQAILNRPVVELKKERRRRRPSLYVPSQDHPWRKTYRKTITLIKNPPLEVTT